MYCTIDDMIESIPPTILAELSDDVDGRIINKEVVITIIDDQSNFIANHIPYGNLPVEPNQLRLMCIDLTSYALYKRRVGIDNIPEDIVSRQEEILMFLKEINTNSN